MIRAPAERATKRRCDPGEYAVEMKERPATRLGRLTTAAKGLSGRTYPAGTEVVLGGRGSAVDGYVAGDRVPLA